MSDTTPPAKPRLTGRIESAMLKLFTRTGQVLEIEETGPAFRLVTISGDALRGVAWTPGDKIQVQLGGWVWRTYTPIDWDAGTGRARILICLHADGPGTQWARSLRTGDACIILGPRKSIDLTRLAGYAFLFGDETSFGLAAALLGRVPSQSVELFFEVSSLEQAQPALARLGLENAHLGVRADDDAHLAALEEEMLAMAEARPTANIVLSGRASSIQSVRKMLKRLGTVSSRVQVRAYWATGKTGMD